MRTPAPSRQRLKYWLTYSKRTGLFTWRRRASARVYKGDIAGCRRSGYVVITFDGVDYYAHHLAWLYVYGEWPLMLDHEDRIRHHNRIDNLRIADNSLNKMNSGIPTNNTSGVRGVSMTKNGKWRVDCQGRYLGTYAAMSEAITTYERAAS